MIKADKKLVYASIFSISWALAIFFRKVALNEGAHPIAFLVHSGSIAAFILTTYVVAKRRGEFRRIKRPSYRLFALMGLLVGTAWVVDTWGLKFTTTINYSLLIKSSFLFSILLGYFVFGEKITKQKLVLIVIFAVGAWFITTSGRAIIPQFGDLLVLLTALLYSLTSTVQKKLTKKAHSDIVAWARTSSAALFLVLITFILGSVPLEIVSPISVLLVGVLFSSITIFMNKTLSIASLSYMTMMTMSVPVISGVLGLAFLNESMTSVQIVGGILILASGMAIQKIKV